MDNIRDSEVKLYRLRGEVSSADHDFCMDYLNPVEVLGEDGTRIGWATITDPHNLNYEASLVLCYSSPERLNLQNGEKHYIHMNGLAVYAEDESLGCITDLEHLDEVQLTSLVLSRRQAFEDQFAVYEE